MTRDGLVNVNLDKKKCHISKETDPVPLYDKIWELILILTRKKEEQKFVYILGRSEI